MLGGWRGRGLWLGFGLQALMFGEIGLGDLEGVEKEPGAACVDVVDGEAEHDGADGLLNLGA
jgi:hypothetical protein